MANFTITKVLDGDDVWGRKRIEHVVLQPAVSDYPTGGYLLQGISGSTESTGNVGLGKVSYAWPCGGQGGYVPVWAPSSSRVQVFRQNGTTGPLIEVPASTDLSAYAFNLLVLGTS